MSNLMEGLIDELRRVRELLENYKRIGQSGMFGATVLEADIEKAEESIASGDIVEMVQSLETLRGCE